MIKWLNCLSDTVDIVSWPGLKIKEFGEMIEALICLSKTVGVSSWSGLGLVLSLIITFYKSGLFC